MARYQKRGHRPRAARTPERATRVDSNGNLYYKGLGGYLQLVSRNWGHIYPTKKLRVLYNVTSEIYLKKTDEITELNRFGLVELDEMNAYKITSEGLKTLEEVKKFIKESILKGYVAHDLPENILARNR